MPDEDFIMILEFITGFRAVLMDNDNCANIIEKEATQEVDWFMLELEQGWEHE